MESSIQELSEELRSYGKVSFVANKYLQKLVMEFGKKITKEAIIRSSKGVKSGTIITVVSEKLEGELGVCAVQEMNKTKDDYLMGKIDHNGKKRGDERYNMKVCRSVKHMMQEHVEELRLSKLAVLCLSAAIEYLLLELLEITGRFAYLNRRAEITDDDIEEVLEADEELKESLL